MQRLKKMLLIAGTVFGFATAPGAYAELKPGDTAPDFKVSAAQGGKEFTFALAESLKTGPAVVYFYPKSFTSVCTVEAHTFAENMDNFKAAGASVIGISADDIKVQLDFSAKECRDKFPVGADPTLTVIKAYDAVMSRSGMGPLANRISYVVAPDGKILYAFTSSEAEKHVANTLNVVRKWRADHPAAANATRPGSGY
jgi:thioredoxin-dependent peroxiredoxin